MVSIATIQDLFAHMQWADAAVWKAVLASPTATEAPKLQEVLHHLHVVQRAFLKVWRGESFEEALQKFSEAQALLEWARSYYEEANACLSSLDEDGLRQPMPMPWAAIVEKQLGRPPESTTIGETALQVALHSTYHRGQANARLRELGGEPPQVDYIVWLWRGRPAVEWD